MFINKIIFLGSSNALKPYIIMDLVLQHDLLRNKKLLFVTDSNNGICVDLCKKNGVEIIVIEQNKFNDTDVANLALLKGDLLVSLGWPYLIPLKILDLFKKCINCHGSLLPDYRGIRAYMHYYANCEDYYGATIHYMNENLDDGMTIVQGSVKRFEGESTNMMHRRTAEITAYMLPEAIRRVEEDFEGFIPKGAKRYFYKLTPEEFEEYYVYNSIMKKNGEKIRLTPHKELS